MERLGDGERRTHTKAALKEWRATLLRGLHRTPTGSLAHDARTPPRDHDHRRIHFHGRRVLHLRRPSQHRTSRARLCAAREPEEPEEPVPRYGVRYRGNFLLPGFARFRPRRADPRRDRPRRALHHRARRWRPILAPGRSGRSRPERANAGRLSDHGQPQTQPQPRHQAQIYRRCDISLNIPRIFVFRRRPEGPRLRSDRLPPDTSRSIPIRSNLFQLRSP